MNISFEHTKYLIKTDIKRITNKSSSLTYLFFILKNHSFKTTFWFRFGSYIDNNKNCILKLLAIIIKYKYKKIQYKTGIQLPLHTQIDGGLNFAHFSCIVINGNAIIGKNCTIFQGVTIGSIRGKGTPIIGNNVVIASGAKVLGNITIGNNVFIGANSVVISSIPDNAVAVGNPAKVVNYNGLKNVSLYE